MILNIAHLVKITSHSSLTSLARALGKHDRLLSRKQCYSDPRFAWNVASSERGGGVTCAHNTIQLASRPGAFPPPTAWFRGYNTMCRNGRHSWKLQ